MPEVTIDPDDVLERGSSLDPSCDILELALKCDLFESDGWRIMLCGKTTGDPRSPMNDATVPSNTRFTASSVTQKDLIRSICNVSTFDNRSV